MNLLRLLNNLFHGNSEKTRKRYVAKVFNDTYTFNYPYFKNTKWDKENAWMCPDCNTIHAPINVSGLAGLCFPRCCSTTHTDRYYEDIDRSVLNDKIKKQIQKER